MTGQPTGTRHAMFIEDESTSRGAWKGASWSCGACSSGPRHGHAHADDDVRVLIGNTDFSIYALHNVKIVQRPDKSLQPVPYDMDFSGLVHTPYAAPDRNLMLKSVRDRLYRGPCRRPEQIDPYIANFVAKKTILLALPDSIPGMTKAEREDAKSYLDEFFDAIKTPKDAKRLFVDCSEKSTM